MQTLRVHILGVGSVHPASWLWAPAATEQKSQVCMRYLSCILQSSLNLVMNKDGWWEQQEQHFTQDFQPKSRVLCCTREGSSPRLSLVLLQHTRHGCFYYCSRGKVVNDGGKAYMLKSTSPRATGTQSLCRVKISLPLPNYLKMFYYLKI